MVLLLEGCGRDSRTLEQTDDRFGNPWRDGATYSLHSQLYVCQLVEPSSFVVDLGVATIRKNAMTISHLLAPLPLFPCWYSYRALMLAEAPGITLDSNEGCAEGLSVEECLLNHIIGSFDQYTILCQEEVSTLIRITISGSSPGVAMLVGIALCVGKSEVIAGDIPLC